jgi:hypothetical protein
VTCAAEPLSAFLAPVPGKAERRVPQNCQLSLRARSKPRPDRIGPPDPRGVSRSEAIGEALPRRRFAVPL